MQEASQTVLTECASGELSCITLNPHVVKDIQTVELRYRRP